MQKGRHRFSPWSTPYRRHLVTRRRTLVEIAESKLTIAFAPSLRLSPISFARTLRALLLLRYLSRTDQFIRISRTLLVVIAVAIDQEKLRCWTQILFTFFSNLDSAHVRVVSLALPITPCRSHGLTSSLPSILWRHPWMQGQPRPAHIFVNCVRHLVI